MSNPQKPTDVGMNKTGAAMSPIDSKRTEEGATTGRLHLAPGTDAMDGMRLAYAQEAKPVGTMPPPATPKGMLKTVVAKVKGERPNVFLDRIGERLAYERGGVRLYDALLVKYAASDAHDATITAAALQEIRDDELRHYGVLVDAIKTMGADPTAMTPSADVVGVATMGFMQVLTDPHTTFSQCLCTMLMVEVADSVSWELLVDMATQLGHEKIAEEFRVCAAEEQRHVAQVRRWAAVMGLGQAGVDVDQPSGSPA